LLAHDRWFSPGTPASSTTKTGCHDIAEILLKVVLSTIKVKRSGFIQLNHYNHLLQQTDSPNCTCEAEERVIHYLLDCPNYEDIEKSFEQNYILLPEVSI
jgi:hypothetical protein